MKVLLFRWKSRWRVIFTDLVSLVGIYWLFVEIFSYSTNGTTDQFFKNLKTFLIFFFILCVIAVCKNKPKTAFGYFLRGKDNYVEIKVGDAFENSGALVIPVNNRFDMSLSGNVTNAHSLQNQFIKAFYAGKHQHLETDIAAKIQAGIQYPIGKTIEIEQSGRKFYLLVNSVKKENNRVQSTIDDFITALNGLWQYIAIESGRNAVVTIPLINTQHGRDANLSKTSAIKQIIDSYVELSKSLNICGKLIISIYPADLKNAQIDLDELDDYLKYTCRFYRKITQVQKEEDPQKGSKIIAIDD